MVRSESLTFMGADSDTISSGPHSMRVLTCEKNLVVLEVNSAFSAKISALLKRARTRVATAEANDKHGCQCHHGNR